MPGSRMSKVSMSSVWEKHNKNNIKNCPDVIVSPQKQTTIQRVLEHSSGVVVFGQVDDLAWQLLLVCMQVCSIR